MKLQFLYNAEDLNVDGARKTADEHLPGAAPESTSDQPGSMNW